MHINQGADELMVLSIEAATSLDSISRGRTGVDLVCIEQLRRRLGEFNQAPMQDLQVLLALRQAFETSRRQHFIKVPHVVRGVQSVRGRLQRVLARYKRSARKAGAAELRVFCVNLSRAAQARRVSK